MNEYVSTTSKKREGRGILGIRITVARSSCNIGDFLGKLVESSTQDRYVSSTTLLLSQVISAS